MHQPTEATLDIAASKMRSPLAALARSTLRVCLWDRPTLAVLVLVQILLLLPALMGYPTLSDQAIGQEQARQTREILSTSTANGVYDSAPADLKDINARELTVLGEAASTPYPSRDFFDAYARYYDIELESVKAGYSEPDPSLYARSELIHRLAQLENPEVYDTAAEMSATYYLAFVLGLMPGIVPLLPIALLAGASQRRLATRSLEQATPIHRAKKRTTALGVALALALAALALELAPATLLALVRNGLGNLAYPVVQIVDGNVASTTVGEVLAKDMALIMGAALVTTALAATAEAILPSCGLGLSLALLLAPLLPLYASRETEWQKIARHLPSSYLSCGSVVGMPVYANGLDIRVISGTTWELGCATLLAFAAALVLAALLVDSLQERSRSGRLQRRFS